MQDISPEESMSIAPRQLVSLLLAQSRTIRVVCGRVWLTIEADVNDYWLSAGDTLVLAPGRHIVIEADPAVSCIDVPAPSLMPAVSSLGAAAPAARVWRGDEPVDGLFCGRDLVVKTDSIPVALKSKISALLFNP